MRLVNDHALLRALVNLLNPRMDGGDEHCAKC